jgi:mono/diheme cytochrome c family protein
MTRRLVLNSALFLLLLSLLGFNWWASPDQSKPNFEFLPQMAHGARYNAFAANPNFADGQTLQAPVSGTIARGELPLHYAPTAADAARAGEELLSPVSTENVRARARGEQVFKNFCTPCHGADATGMSPVTQRGVPPPPSLFAPHAAQMKDGQLFHILTYGQNNMAAYAGQVSREDRWNVIAYVRSLQAAKQPPAAAPTPAVPVKTASRPRSATGGSR